MRSASSPTRAPPTLATTTFSRPLRSARRRSPAGRAATAAAAACRETASRPAPAPRWPAAPPASRARRGLPARLERRRRIPGRRPRSSPASAARRASLVRRLAGTAGAGDRGARRRAFLLHEGRADQRARCRGSWRRRSCRRRRRRPSAARLAWPPARPGASRSGRVSTVDQRLDGVDGQRHRAPRRRGRSRARRRRGRRASAAPSRPRRLATGSTLPRRFARPSRPLGACGTRATAGRRMTSATWSAPQGVELAVDAKRQEALSHSAA